MGIPHNIRSSAAYSIVKNGLMYGRDREGNPEAALGDASSFFNDSSGVYALDSSFNSYREGSDTRQMMTLILDPKVLDSEQWAKMGIERKYWSTSPYCGEVSISSSISSDDILGAIVPDEGHNELYNFQINPDEDLAKLEKLDKERYASFERYKKKGSILECVDNSRVVGVSSFYRGLIWGMNDFPENAFPVFNGFYSSHFPYNSGAGLDVVNKDTEIPLEYYLAGQIFPLTSEAHLKHVSKDMISKAGNSPREVGLIFRGINAGLSPEKILNRELTPMERAQYDAISFEEAGAVEIQSSNIDSDREGSIGIDPVSCFDIPAEWGKWEDLDVYQRREMFLSDKNE